MWATMVWPSKNARKMCNEIYRKLHLQTEKRSVTFSSFKFSIIFFFINFLAVKFVENRKNHHGITTTPNSTENRFFFFYFLDQR